MYRIRPPYPRQNFPIPLLRALFKFTEHLNSRGCVKLLHACISYSFLRDKSPQDLATHILSHSFCWSKRNLAGSTTSHKPTVSSQGLTGWLASHPELEDSLPISLTWRLSRLSSSLAVGPYYSWSLKWEASTVPYHVDLSIEYLITRQLASSEQARERAGESTSKVDIIAFYI